MPIIQYTELIDRAAAAADMTDNYITQNQLLYWLNKENLALATLIARSGWVENIQSFTITPTGAEVGKFILNFPLIPLAIVSVHEVAPNTQSVRALKHQNPVEFLRQIPGSTVNPFGHSKEYRVIWDQTNDQLYLNFYPEPAAGISTYLVQYIPAPLKVVTNVTDATRQATSVVYPLGWEEHIVLGMAREALDKEESDTSRVVKKIDEMDRRIEEHCYGRVLSSVPTIRNSDSDERGWQDKMIYPPPLQYFWI